MWAAAATTDDVPVPWEPFQLLRLPDSKPSVKTVSVYCESAARGVTGGVCAEAGPCPTALAAATVNVYGTPLLRPLTVKLVAVEEVAIGACAVPPTYGVTKYPVIEEPPSDGAVQLRLTDWSAGDAVTPVGAPGTVAAVGITAAEELELGPMPTPLIAATVNVYAVPFVRPVTV